MSLGGPARRGLGAPHLHLRRTDSTNDRARILALDGAPHGTLVSADAQSAGRGRQGRRWSAPDGTALLMSLVLRGPPRLLSLAAAVAVAEVAGSGALIKWPNDVLLDGRKVAGILIEGRPQEDWLVLGIGLNVAVDLGQLPGDVRARAGTLGRGAAEIGAIREQLLDRLDAWLAASPAAVLDAWRGRDALLGREVAWAHGRGQACGIDGEGRLVVALAHGGRAELCSGEVHLAG